MPVAGSIAVQDLDSFRIDTNRVWDQSKGINVMWTPGEHGAKQKLGWFLFTLLKANHEKNGMSSNVDEAGLTSTISPPASTTALKEKDVDSNIETNATAAATLPKSSRGFSTFSIIHEVDKTTQKVLDLADKWMAAHLEGTLVLQPWQVCTEAAKAPNEIFQSLLAPHLNAGEISIRRYA